MTEQHTENTQTVVTNAIQMAIKDNTGYMEETGLQPLLEDMLVYLLGSHPEGDEKISRLLEYVKILLAVFLSGKRCHKNNKKTDGHAKKNRFDRKLDNKDTTPQGFQREGGFHCFHQHIRVTEKKKKKKKKKKGKFIHAQP